MIRSTRRAALAGSTAAFAIGTFGAARAADFRLKYGSNVPATHPLNVRMTEAAERIKRETAGRVELALFPNNQLGGDTDMLSQVRTGALELFTLSGLILSTLVPVASINGIGFAFKDYDQVFAAMDGAVGAHVREAVAKVGLIALDKIWDNGFRQTTTSTIPITKPEDFKGLKIRVPVSPLWTSMFKALGASPVSINFAEVYSALQTKIADAEENPLAVVSTAKLYEVQKFCSLTNHMWDGFWMLANRRAFQALPADIQTIVTTAINDAALRQRADVRTLNEGLHGELTAKGMIFNEPDISALREALMKAGFYAEWKGKYGDEAWAILEKSVGGLT